MSQNKIHQETNTMSAKIITTLNDFISEFIQKFDNEEQLECWNSTDNQNAFEKIVSSLVNKKLQKLAKKEKQEKEKGPKKGKTAYLFFCSSERSSMKKKYPELTNKEITKKLGEKWTSIKDDEDKIKIYKDMAMEDKERFEKEKAEMNIDGDGETKTKKTGVKKNKSAYIFFCDEERARIKEENPEMPAKEVMKELGRRWKALDSDEVDKFKQMAEEDKERYQEEKKNSGDEGEEEVEKPKKTRKPRKKKVVEETDGEAESENDSSKKRGRPKKVKKQEKVKLPVEESDNEEDEKPKKKIKKKVVVEDSDNEDDDKSTVVDEDNERAEKIARIKTSPPLKFIKFFKDEHPELTIKEVRAQSATAWTEMSVDEKIEYV